MTAKRFRLLTLWTCIGMFLVLIVGVVVTNTESGRGCGTDWPLCNGKFVPAYTLESMVEYSHRAVSGIEGLLVGAVFIWTLVLKPFSFRKELIVYASGALLFTIAQALLGAAAVIWPASDAVLAIHFGISMIAFTFTWLLDSTARRWKRGEAAGSGAAAAGGSAKPAAAIVPKALYGWIIAILVYCYGVVYLGAYVRHTASAGGCYGWPLCNGKFVPELSGATGIVFAHRLGAAIFFLIILALALHIRYRLPAFKELRALGDISLALTVAQILSGWLLTETLDQHDAYVFTSLLHTIIITALFSLLSLLAIRSWQLSRR